MAEDRPPPPKGSEPGAVPRDDDSVPRHRVVWDHGPLGPPIQPDHVGMARGTVRMVRPTLSAGPASLGAPEPPVPSVVEMAPTTERVPQGPGQVPPAQPGASTASTMAYGSPNQAQAVLAQAQAAQAQAQAQAQVGHAQGQHAQGHHHAPGPGQPGAQAQPPTHALARTAAMGPSPLATASPARPVTAPPPPPRVAPSRKVDPRLVLLSEPDSARAASFRRLRDNLLAKGLPRVLAVSSPAKHDGKTTCAVNLALALAEHTPARVLLIDGNFFEPSLAGIFSIDEQTPSVPLPVAGNWVEPYKLAELMPCLHVAAIVRSPREPLPRFEKQRFDMLLDRLCRVGYDYLIIDAPALEGTPMVSQLLGGADGVLLAVRSGRTTARALRHAVEELPGGRGLGIALMDAEPKA